MDDKRSPWRRYLLEGHPEQVGRRVDGTFGLARGAQRSVMTETDPQVLLIRRAQTGNRDALDMLLRRELPAVRRAAARMVNDHADIDDVTQKALIQAVQWIDTFRGDSSFRTWIVRITIRVAWNHVRSSKKVVSLSAAAERLRADTHSQNVATAAEVATDVKRVKMALARIPTDQRTVFVLRDIEGYTTNEIAKALDIPPGTVSTRLRSARTRVREALIPATPLKRIGSEGGVR